MWMWLTQALINVCLIVGILGNSATIRQLQGRIAKRNTPTREKEN